MMVSEKPLKFIFAYTLAAVIYYAFDYLYMPWLAYRFSYWLFLPLYLSILIANFLGIFLYDFLKEDVLFIELGRNWLNKKQRGGGKKRGKSRRKGKKKGIEKRKISKRIKNVIKNSRRLTFVVLSIWPSPIAGYLFFRKNSKDRGWRALGVIAIGSIFCTAVYGGGLSLALFLIKRIISHFTAA